MRRLPPFAELVAFEAVGRLLSFTKAAEELCITQSAVSHRVGRLEKHFGVQLIKRLNPGIALTEAGATMLPTLAETFDTLARLEGAPRRERRLKVAAGSALCTWWLAGRLGSFIKQSPHVSVDVVPIENDARDIPEVDVRILWIERGEESERPRQAVLFNEEVFPVCSPRLLPGGTPLNHRRELAAMTLLHKASSSSGEWSWSAWFDHLGIERNTKGQELRFADIGVVLSAAVDGAGVALSRSLLVHDALLRGSLVVPIAEFAPMVSSKTHVARWRRDKDKDADVGAFVSWLVAEASASVTATSKMIRDTGTKQLSASTI